MYNEYLSLPKNKRACGGANMAASFLVDDHGFGSSHLAASVGWLPIGLHLQTSAPVVLHLHVSPPFSLYYFFLYSFLYFLLFSFYSFLYAFL